MIKLNQKITNDMLNNFSFKSSLSIDLKNEICKTLKQGLEFRKFCKKNGEDIELQGEIEFDIYGDPYICVYSKWEDTAFLYLNHQKVIKFYATKDIIVDDNYKSNKILPKFIKPIITEMIRYKLLKVVK